MKPVKFITTFSENGYHVYGKEWISSFLEKTQSFSNIVAEIYVNDMELPEATYSNKISFLNYNKEIPERNHWMDLFLKNTTHDPWNRDLALKFSFKSFVMMHCLKNTSDGFVIWLDADCMFLNNEFINWPSELIEDNFIACQREDGSEHVESGIIIFNAEHHNKEKFINTLNLLYQTPKEFNGFSQFFDGFAIGRTLDIISVPYVDLNEGYGRKGIQSDPSCTFLNPEIRKRFIHNIGITGKKKYDQWDKYKHDALFQLINGVNDLPPEELKRQKLLRVADKLKSLKKK